MLDHKKKLEIFQAQTRNVRELQATWEHLKRSIHKDLLSKNTSSAVALTRLLALTYCAWMEALFSKLIHTPYGFEIPEIEKIKKATSNTIVHGWKKCVELALKRVKLSSPDELDFAETNLKSLVKTYVEVPSQLRNRIAHGQVVVALNSSNEAENKKLSNDIKELDIVKLDLLRTGALALADMIEMLIESPET
jgi:hypothetical protein